jgi:hypothetical protein
VRWVKEPAGDYIVLWDHDVFAGFLVAPATFASPPTLPKPSISNLFGFGAASTTSSTFTIHAIAVPYWLLILLSMIPATLLLGRHLRLKRRLELNLCAECGYDLRETPDRCPECGAAPSGRQPQLASSSAAT